MLAGGPLGREQARAVPSPLDANATSACYPVPARRSCAVCRPPVHHVTSVTPRRNASRVRASMPVPGRRTESHARRLGPRARPVSGHAGRLPVLTQSRFDRAAIFRFFTPGFGRDRPPPTHADATAGRGISLVSAAAGALSTQMCSLREPNALRMPNGQFCRCNLRRASLYDFLHRHGKRSCGDTASAKRRSARYAANHAARVAQNGRFVSCGRPESRQTAFWRCLNELHAHDVAPATSTRMRRN